jgi:hypothetical protein
MCDQNYKENYKDLWWMYSIMELYLMKKLMYIFGNDWLTI